MLLFWVYFTLSCTTEILLTSAFVPKNHLCLAKFAHQQRSLLSARNDESSRSDDDEKSYVELDLYKKYLDYGDLDGDDCGDLHSNVSVNDDAYDSNENGATIPKNAIPWSSLLGMLYSTVFFYGLDEPTSRNNKSTRVTSHRGIVVQIARGNLNSPFFTRSEQIAMQVIKISNAAKKEKGKYKNNNASSELPYDPKDLGSLERYSEQLCEYISQIQNAINVLKITLSELENGAWEEADVSGMKSKGELYSELALAERRLEKAKVELVTIVALKADLLV